MQALVTPTTAKTQMACGVDVVDHLRVCFVYHCLEQPSHCTENLELGLGGRLLAATTAEGCADEVEAGSGCSRCLGQPPASIVQPGRHQTGGTRDRQGLVWQVEQLSVACGHQAATKQEMIMC